MTHDRNRFTWCSADSTGTIVADRPITPANERSNSPTTNVHSADTARNSSADCEPKIACTVETPTNLSGMITA